MAKSLCLDLPQGASIGVWLTTSTGRLPSWENALSLSGVAEAGADGVAMDAPTGGESDFQGLMDADTL